MPLDDLYKEAPVGGYAILPEGEYVVVVTKAIMRVFNMQAGEVQALVLKLKVVSPEDKDGRIAQKSYMFFNENGPYRDRLIKNLSILKGDMTVLGVEDFKPSDLFNDEVLDQTLYNLRGRAAAVKVVHKQGRDGNVFENIYFQKPAVVNYEEESGDDTEEDEDPIPF